MTADAVLAAFAAVCACIGALVVAELLWPDREPFGDTVPDMAPPPRYSDRRDAADDIEEE